MNRRTLLKSLTALTAIPFAKATVDEKPVEAAKISLAPGDVLAVRVVESTTTREMQKLHEVLWPIFPHNPVLITRPGVEFTIIPRGENTGAFPAFHPPT